MTIPLIYIEYIHELSPKLKSFSICSHEDKDSLNDYFHINVFYNPPV